MEPLDESAPLTCQPMFKPTARVRQLCSQMSSMLSDSAWVVFKDGLAVFGCSSWAKRDESMGSAKDLLHRPLKSLYR